MAPLPLDDRDSSFPDDPDLGIVKEPGLGLGGGVDVKSMFPRWKPNELEDEDGVGRGADSAAGAEAETVDVGVD